MKAYDIEVKTKDGEPYVVTVIAQNLPKALIKFGQVHGDMEILEVWVTQHNSEVIV